MKVIKYSVLIAFDEWVSSTVTILTIVSWISIEITLQEKTAKKFIT